MSATLPKCSTAHRIHGVAVSDNAQYFYGHTSQLLNDFHMGDVKATDIVDIIDGYKGRGYGLSTPEELGKSKSLFFCCCTYVVIVKAAGSIIKTMTSIQFD